MKFRDDKNFPKVGLKAQFIELYKEFWNDCILCVVVPVKDYFYMQYVNRLKPFDYIGDSAIFDLKKQFLPIYEFFQEIDPDEIVQNYSDVVKMIPRLKNASED